MKNKIKNQIKNQIAILLVFIFLFSSLSFAAPIGIEDEVSAYLLGDFESGEILEGYNIDKPLEVASITKLMTYLIVMDKVKKGNISLDDSVYIDAETAIVKGSSFNLKEGEIFSVETLLESLLIVSANDSAIALAKHIGKDINIFVKMMNDKAREIGLENTFYLNPTGLPEEQGQNIMSIRDIFLLSRYIINKYPEILEITKKPYMDMNDREFLNENTNPLLNEIKGVDGLKTGFTNKAGYCLVATADIDGQVSDENFRLISIVMGTKNEEKRKETSKILLGYGISNYAKKLIFSKNAPIGVINIPDANEKEVLVYPEKDIYLLMKIKDDISQETIIDEDIKLPLKDGDKVGKVILSDDKGTVEEIKVVVRENVKKANIFIKIGRYFKKVLTYILGLFF